jgi:uncharacterized membrane protein YjgN (DUF898 family)
VHEVTTPPPSPFAPYEPPKPTVATVAFSGDRRAFINLVIRGAALGLVTFGFYRFWLATYVRRHLWSGTAVDGDAPEYTGTAIELLIGFLFALAILVPVYLLYFLAGLQAEIYQAFASIPLVIFIFLFAQFAIYRARRYRMTRTVWRGVRFWMRGSGWNYAWRAVLWSLWVAISLGAALPWRTAALERFKMRYSYYGDLQGRFEGTGRALFKEGWPFWLGTIFVVGIGAFIPPVLWIGGPFLYDLKMSALIDLYWKVIGWAALFATIAGTIIVIVGVAAVFAAGIDFSDVKQFARMLEQQPYLTAAVLIVAGLLYLATILAIGVVTQVYLTRDLWQRVAATTTVYNLSAADNVIAQGEVASALGEGFADGLDVGGL